MDDFRLERFTQRRRDDFLSVHSDTRTDAHCYCVAWWVATWEGWSDRTSEQNLDLRNQLLESGEYDGYLAYLGDVPVGWCQVGPRDRLAKLVKAFELAPDPDTWAITCFHIVPGARGKGVAGRMLQAVVGDLRTRGVRRVEGFPRRGEGHPPEEVWTGTESMFESAGFRVVADNEKFPVLAIELGDGGPPIRPK